MFPINSEANDSELMENLEEMFARYHMHSDMVSMFKIILSVHTRRYRKRFTFNILFKIHGF